MQRLLAKVKNVFMLELLIFWEWLLWLVYLSKKSVKSRYIRSPAANFKSIMIILKENNGITLQLIELLSISLDNKLWIEVFILQWNLILTQQLCNLKIVLVEVKAYYFKQNMDLS